ncbi:MAG: efflux RND transporter periplasmic adaptor subunit [Syntrophales bacterium LBB04]|nr:efflux RND transporter periplasmic adaptor subunit [Syntrophales bacterium LBB04]
MKRKYWLIIPIIVFVAAVFLVIMKKHEIAALPKPQSYKQTIQTALISQGKLETTTHYLGVIESYARADLSARISGNILSVKKREGDSINKGELVAVIDDREFSDRALAIDAEASATKYRLAGAKSTFDTQKSIYERDVMLYKEGAISKEALERSKAAYDGAQATMSAAGETLQGLQRSAAVARTQTGYAHISAPFGGIVVKRWSEPGDLAVPGKPILTIEKLSPCKVVTQVPQEEISRIQKGTKAYLRIGQQSMTTTVNLVYPSLSKNLLGSVEIILPSSPFSLPSGSSVGVDFVTNEVTGLIVPENALVKTGKGTFIYLIDKDVVRIRQVELLGTGMERAAVRGPINAGNMVAVGQENKLLGLAEGSAVNPVVSKP